MPVVYMLWCNDGSLYTGWTNHLAKRLTAHNAGTGGKYTRSRLPVALAWYQECDDKISAMQLEYKIKHKMTRKQKLALISKDKEL
ncbi:MAG: GIY-YIG nuclease family protein [Clostridiales Family XIII bacterium]|nr:GIY-YIG nuclease family protein [Clostridiales Family XIII bacterium]